MYFRNYIISQLKDAYTRLKNFLQVSSGNLFDIVKNIKNLIKNKINDYIITLARYRDRPPHDIYELEFDNILYKITP